MHHYQLANNYKKQQVP